jgi:hypothetical protein
MPIYVHYQFLGWLKFDFFPLFNGFLDMQAEDSALISVMISSIVELVVFLPFEFSSQRDHMICE